MDKIVGKFAVDVWVDGWPVWTKLTAHASNGEKVTLSLSAEDLNDLQYIVKAAKRAVEARNEEEERRRR